MKKALLAILPILVLTLFLTPIYSANVVEPQLKITGKITTDVTDLSNILLGVDTSMFSDITVKNATLPVVGIELSKQFLNATIDDSLITVSAGNSYYVDLLRDTNGISYLLLKIYNTSAITTSTWYDLSLMNKLDVELNGENDYFIFIAKVQNISGTVSYYCSVTFDFVDEFGNTYSFVLKLHYDDRGYSSSTKTIYVYLEDARTNVIQVHLEDVIKSVGLSIRPVKLTKIVYKVAYYETGTPESSYEIAGMFYAAIVTSTPFKINGILVNDTKYITNITSKTITSSLAINKIADVQIDFEGTLKTADVSNVPDELARVYFWQFKFNSTWYSNLQANLTKGDADDIIYAYLNGVDITSSFNTTGYYTFSVSTDTQYVVQVKAKFSADEYDQLVGTFTAPSPWQPTKAIPWWFWYIIFLLASALGIAGAKEVAAQKLREIKSNP